MKKTILTNEEAAKYIGCKPSTLKQSRVSGILFSQDTPKHLKMGRNVRYKLSTLDTWLNQFPEKSNTTAYAITGSIDDEEQEFLEILRKRKSVLS